MQISSAATTKRKTGIATAHQFSHAGQAENIIETQGAKKAAI